MRLLTLSTVPHATIAAAAARASPRRAARRSDAGMGKGMTL
jgi:hypothetical protein